MTYINQANGHRETVGTLGPVIWTLLFGPLYFMVRGVWSHAVLSIIIGIITVGLSWFIYPFFAPGIVRKNYLSRGWKEA